MGRMHSPVRPHVNIYLYFHLHISVALKLLKFTNFKMKTFGNTFPPYEDLQIWYGMLSTSHITPHTTLGTNEFLMPKTLAWSLQH